MDSDEFDDGVADEDLILAATQLQSAPSGAAGPASKQQDYIDLDDWPSDAFGSSPASRASLALIQQQQAAAAGGFRPVPALGAPAQNYRQTTLFGLAAQAERDLAASSSQRARQAVYRTDKPPEPPSHHELDVEAMQTWVYPTNIGAIRDYQYSIVKNGLFNNTLVALPTGLGKTFIAATVMLNFFRWTKTAKIVFVAPTKPLAQQQVDACFHTVGIPRSQTTLLTGEVAPALRVEEWQTKRVFFMTPQTLENDLSAGYADPKSICLLVVDEAHRATGNYSYVKVVSFIQRFSSSFRVLALTATPGSKVEGVQDVIDNLHISHIEIRTEESIDIRSYIHSREEDIVLLDPSDEMREIQRLFSAALKPIVDKLSQQNIYYGRDPMALTVFGLMNARKDWAARAGQHANQGVKFMMMAIFTLLQSLAHSIKLLNFHGIKPFYDNLTAFRDEVEGKGEKGSKYKKQIIESSSFKEMMSKIAAWSSKGDFVSHPKLTYLSDTVLNHFLDRGEGREGVPPSSSGTRIIVFSEFRDSAEEIARVLNTHAPLVRAAVFVGQADSKKSMGMKQAEQIERIRKFKAGDLNVLVATSIGEEGLDIGQVDLIVCYDASSSPIRMLQRMGRTGRKRAGRAVLLLMKGKEEDKYTQSKDNYEKMQQMICDGSRFAFRHDLSRRIVPKEIQPTVDKRPVDIPIENTQNKSAPEPRKRALKKKPPKKFHMPDDVVTGFTTVASMLGAKPKPKPKPVKHAAPAKKERPVDVELRELTDVPSLSKVLLSDGETRELNQTYRNLPFHSNLGTEEIDQIDLTAFPKAQRTLRKTVKLKHGKHTKRCVKLFGRLAKLQSASDCYTTHPRITDGNKFAHLPLPTEGSDTDEARNNAGPSAKRRKITPEPDVDLCSDHERGPAKIARPPAPRGRPKKIPAPKKARKSTEPTDGACIELDSKKENTFSRAKGRGAAKAVPKKKAAAPKKAAAAAKPAPEPRGRPKKKAAGKAGTTAAGFYDESADEGDDCRRTSDLELSEDSDDGSDLVDFVVGDDVMTSSAAVVRNDSDDSGLSDSDLDVDMIGMGPRRTVSSGMLSSSTIGARQRSSSPTSPSHQPSSPPLPKGRQPKRQSKPYELLSGSEDDTDDDMPSMSQLIGQGSSSAARQSASKHRKNEKTADGSSDGDANDIRVLKKPSKQKVTSVGRAGRRGGRRILSDEDDEDDDEDDDIF
ncbi:ATP-dependent DNA helicase MPH1 [Microdochium nivale]|nr:ATP-dependent DNA helicase MPH1 [Microdochium nivale]